jgi:hypothetical protein
MRTRHTAPLILSCPTCEAVFDTARKLAGHRAGKHRAHVGVKASSISTQSLSDLQGGYIAGFLDGEGGIQITRSARRNREYQIALPPSVYFTNTNEDSIRTLRTWLGGESITKRKEIEGHKDTFVLTISGVKSILTLLGAIRSSLIIKAERADVIIDYCESRMSHYRGKGRRFTDSELRLYTTLKWLNQRGGANQRQRTDR